MAVQNFIQQSIVFISSTGEIDQDTILANGMIQTFAANSAAADLIQRNESFLNWNGSTWTSNSLLMLSGFITATFQTALQNNMPALQQAFPQYTVQTWGNNAAYGF